MQIVFSSQRSIPVFPCIFKFPLMFGKGDGVNVLSVVEPGNLPIGASAEKVIQGG